jgi:hypothetical protein
VKPAQSSRGKSMARDVPAALTAIRATAPARGVRSGRLRTRGFWFRRPGVRRAYFRPRLRPRSLARSEPGCQRRAIWPHCALSAKAQRPGQPLSWPTSPRCPGPRVPCCGLLRIMMPAMARARATAGPGIMMLACAAWPGAPASNLKFGRGRGCQLQADQRPPPAASGPTPHQPVHEVSVDRPTVASITRTTAPRCCMP